MLRDFFTGILFLVIVFYASCTIAQATTPHPDHVVVLILENHSYNQIVGSPAAPYINSLITGGKCALFTQSFGLSHPSQPNYIQLFAGSNLGVTSNNLPSGLPFTAPNLGASLLAAGRTFCGYSESLPSTGYTGEVFGAYARKHNPWVNWQYSNVNGIPDSLNKPFTAFPTNFNLLPAVSFVVPNQTNDMHDGSDPARISIGDSWVQNNLGSYIQWAKTNNSLFILTFDEDDNFSNQHILTFFIGDMVAAGSYTNHIDHYNVLRLLEDMFFLPYAGASSTAQPIDYCWNSCQQPATITPSGPLAFCTGGSVTLTASQGSAYTWSNGATTQSIIAQTAGAHWVIVTDNQNCQSTASVNVTLNNFLSSSVILQESMGTVSVNTTIAAHEANNGFDNDNLTMSGTAEVRASSPSNGYPGATAAGNIYFTTSAGRNFIISGINTLNMPNLQLSFGIFKNANAANGSDFLVQVSSDGVNYTNLSYINLPTGSGTANTWNYRTASGTIPSVANLRIRFLQNGSSTQYRIDDISLKYSTNIPVVSSNGPLTFCPGNSVNLSASIANSYLWSTGATTQSITVSSPGSYSVTETDLNNCSAASQNIAVNYFPAVQVLSLNMQAGIVGSSVSIFGAYFNIISGVSFNGIPASFNVVSSTQIDAIVPSGATTGPVQVSSPCGSDLSSSSFIVVPATITFKLKMFIEGYYIGNSVMNSLLGGNLCDTVSLELRNMDVPNSLVYSGKSILTTSGEADFEVPGSMYAKEFYVIASGRNALKAWSSIPVAFGLSTVYDFTQSSSAELEGNCKDLGDGNFALYSGDITQDGIIDRDDILEMENALARFENGYRIYDLNGDFLVEGADYSLLENHELPLNSSHP